jgi:diguanylate cyclase (GGDEF)-like protein/PAS domain S-box-containing protein
MVANLLLSHLLLSGILFAIVGLYSLRRRQVSAAAIPFSIAMFLLGIFSLLSGLSILDINLDTKILIDRLRLPILPFTTIAFLIATVQNAQRTSWLNHRRIGLLLTLPTLALIISWIPNLQSYLRSNYKLIDTGFLYTLGYENGPWYWLVLGHSVIVAMVIFGIHFNTLLNSKGIYFKQTLLLSIGQIVPAIGIVLLTSGRFPLPGGYNYGPHLLMLTALLNGWAIYRYQWDFAAPMARDIAVDLMSDIMLVVNEAGDINDANTAGLRFFSMSDLEIGKNITKFIPNWDSIRSEIKQQTLLRKEIELHEDSQKKIYELTINPARQPESPFISAYVLVLREITAQKQQQEQIQNLSRAVSQSPNSVLITDPNGIIEYVNPSFTRLTGYSAEEAIGKTPSLFKSGQTPESVYQDMWQTIKAGQIWKGDLLNRRNDGEIYWEETLIAPLFDGYGQVSNYISIKEDITARKEVDEILHRRLEELTMVNTISMAAASQLDLNTLVSLIGQQLEQTFNARSVLIALHVNHSENIEIPYWTIDKKRVHPPVVKYGDGLVSHILKTRETLLISTNFIDIAPPLGHKPVFAEQYGYPKSWLGVPILHRNQALGVISLQNYDKEFAFNQEDVRLLTTIAANISVAIENARLYEIARHSAEEMTLLYEVGLELSTNLDTKEVLRNLFNKCRQILPMDSFYVSVYDEESGHIRYPLFSDRNEFKEVESRDIRTYPGLTGEVILSQKTLYLTDTNQPETAEKYQFIHIGGTPTRSFVGVPMIVRDKVIGVISMQSYLPNYYSAEQIRLFETIANQAAIAIENSRLYEAAHREIKERREAQENLQQTNQELQVQLQRVESLQEELREQAIRDSLTGLFNRRFLDEVFPKQINRIKKQNSYLAVIMLDIDRFKSFNDAYGHSAGDIMLARLGELLQNQTRPNDVACRYGGEEFVILLADTSIEVATKRAEEMRQTFENMTIEFEGRELRTTISIGISVYPDHGEQAEALLIQADQALYQAKANGRNCVVAWTR